MTEEINPIRIYGNWQVGWALDVHTISSTYLGMDPSGYEHYDTVRSPMGELLYKLKYKHDKSVIPEVVRLFTSFAAWCILKVWQMW
jgi:competence protein ComFC